MVALASQITLTVSPDVLGIETPQRVQANQRHTLRETAQPTPVRYSQDNVQPRARRKAPFFQRILSCFGMRTGITSANNTSAPRSHRNAATPLQNYSQAFQQVYPEIRWHDENNILVAGPDGKTRRFPVDRGTKSKPPGPGIPYEERVGRRLAAQTDLIYDAHRDLVHQTIAEYLIDPSAATWAFQVHGKPVSSICGKHAVFALPHGKWMIPQIEFRGCAYACEEMLLGEGKSARKLTKQLRNFRAVENRRSDDEICRSLQARSGLAPKVIQGDTLTSRETVQELKEAIAACGPCIFTVNGHSRILDGIEESAEGLLLTVRDPFSASALTIRDHKTFWTRRMEGEIDELSSLCVSSRWTAIFLTKRRAPKNTRLAAP